MKILTAVFTLSLLAGVSYAATDDGSDSGTADYSDCATNTELVKACQQDFLKYLGDSDVAIELLDVPQLYDPQFLLDGDKLHHMCENENNLKMYYECVFNNLTTCLLNQNKTEIAMPDGGRISEGVVELCQHKDHLNISCIVSMEAEVQKCYRTKTVTEKEQCSLNDALVECTEEHAANCHGGEYIIDFLKAARLQSCGTGTGNRNIAAVWFLLLAVFISFAARV